MYMYRSIDYLENTIRWFDIVNGGSQLNIFWNLNFVDIIFIVCRTSMRTNILRMGDLQSHVFYVDVTD